MACNIDMLAAPLMHVQESRVRLDVHDNAGDDVDGGCAARVVEARLITTPAANRPVMQTFVMIRFHIANVYCPLLTRCGRSPIHNTRRVGAVA